MIAPAQDVVLHNLVSAAKGSVLRRLGDWVARLDNASHVLVCACVRGVPARVAVQFPPLPHSW